MRQGLIFSTLAVLAASCAGVQASSLDWNAFVIRNANGTGDIPPITENADGAGVTTSITEASQKTGYGTSGADGQTVGSLISLSFDRNDAGSGYPYLNIWVTDGTHHALIAPVSDGLAGGGYGLPNDINGLNLQTLGFNIYDNDAANYDWLFPGATRDLPSGGPGSLLKPGGAIVTLSDIASLLIGEGPAVSDAGAPQAGYGVNLVFGDTQGNFTSPIPYQIDNVSLATTAPLPSIAWGGFALIGGLGLVARTRRLQAQKV